MTLNGFFKIILIFLVVVCNIGCDQISKNIVRESIVTNERISVIGNNFILTKVENTGAAMSLGHDLGPQSKFVLLKLLPSLMLVFLLGYLFKSKQLNTLRILAISFLIGGGIGNIYDRFLYDSVTDFMILSFWKFQTGIFNMADVSVMVGVGIMIYEYAHQPKLAT